jgi:enoyl-[acyl-carrier protein] reductase II
VRTRLCELAGTDIPVIQAGMSIYTSPTLAAAVSNAGALGSLGVWQRPVEQLRVDLALLRGLTDRPFALNHVVPDLDEDAFEVTIQAAPAVIAFALDNAGPLIGRVHDAGILAMQQVHTVEQAAQAAEQGADLIVAQGGEAGGYGSVVSTLALVPQVVDAVRPVPVIAAGGIANGRGLVAALSLGAAGVNLGTRFLACEESPVSDRYRAAIMQSSSQDWHQYEYHNAVRPNPGAHGYGTRVRLLRTSFTDKHEARFAERRLSPDDVRREMLQAAEQDRLDELFVSAGQSAGMIATTMSATQVLRDIVSEARDAYLDIAQIFSPGGH